MTVKLQVPFSDSVLEVSDESADFWRERGFRDVGSGKAAKKTAAKKAVAKEEPASEAGSSKVGVTRDDVKEES